MSVLVSVVVPVRDNATGIARCLAGLARQGFWLETIVVDDGSTDDTAEVARATGARVLLSGGRGAAAARNLGLKECRGEVVLFTDADCIPCPGWARALIQPILEGRCIATKGVYRSRQSELTARFVQVEYEDRYDRMRQISDIDFLDTYSLAVRRTDLIQAGGFDEAFRGASVEDQEMSFRLRKLGQFRFVPEAVVEHRHATTPWGYFRKKLRIGRGKATLARRHRDCLKGDSHTPTSLRFQVPFVLAAIPLLVLGAVVPAVWILGVTLLLMPVPLSLSLLSRVKEREGVVFMVWASLLCIVRGVALSVGFAIGVVSPLARLERQPRSALDTRDQDSVIPSPAGLDLELDEERVGETEGALHISS